jgi:hypothetical protein
MVSAFTDAGFIDVAITHRYDCFAATSKERTARRYGVIGVNLAAIRAKWWDGVPRRGAWADGAVA